MVTADILAKGEAKSEALDENELAHLVALAPGGDEETALFEAAYRVKCREIGQRDWLVEDPTENRYDKKWLAWEQEEE